MRMVCGAGAMVWAVLAMSQAAAQPVDRTLPLEVSDVYRIGGSDAVEDWTVFTDVRHVAFGPEGELWIVDVEGRRIVRVAPDGRSGVNYLRRGQGPGEFRLPSDLAVLPDGSAWIGDGQNKTLQLLDATGSLVRGARKPPALVATTITWLGGDEFVAVPEVLFTRRGAMINGGRTFEPAERVPVMRFTVGRDVAVQTIAHASYVQPPRNDVRYAMHAFQPGIHWSAHAGRIAVVDGVEYDVRVLDRTGTEIMHVRRPIEARRPTRADRAAVRELERASMIRPDGTPRIRGLSQEDLSPRNAPAVLRQIEEALDAMTFHDRVPVISGVRYDAQGRLWVERTGDVWGGRPRVDVFSRSGEYLGTASALPRLPDAFGPDGLAAFIEQDDLETPIVRVVRLVNTADLVPKYTNGRSAHAFSTSGVSIRADFSRQ